MKKIFFLAVPTLLLFFLTSCSKSFYDKLPTRKLIMIDGRLFYYYENDYTQDLKRISMKLKGGTFEFQADEYIIFTRTVDGQEAKLSLFFLQGSPFFAIYDYHNYNEQKVEQIIFNFKKYHGFFANEAKTHIIPWEEYVKLGNKLGFYSLENKKTEEALRIIQP